MKFISILKKLAVVAAFAASLITPKPIEAQEIENQVWDESKNTVPALAPTTGNTSSAIVSDSSPAAANDQPEQQVSLASFSFVTELPSGVLIFALCGAAVLVYRDGRRIASERARHAHSRP